MGREAILNTSRVFLFEQAAKPGKFCERKNSVAFFAAVFTYCLVLFGVLISSGHAQQHSNTSSSNPNGNPTTTQAKNDPSSDRVILKVGDIKVTEEEFESRVSGIEPAGADPDKDGATDKDRRRLGDDYASVLMLSQQAVASGLASSPDVSRKLAIARMQVFSDAEFATLMRQAQPSSQEISQYYSAHLSDYDEVQIRRLFIWKTRNKQQDKSADVSKDAPVLTSEAARLRADEIRRQLASGTSEKTVATNLIKSGDGMLDADPLTFARGQLSQAMEKAAFALNEGEWSEVEDTSSRLLIVQLVKRDRETLKQVSPYIEKDLQAHKMQALLDGLKAKAGIWMDEQYFGAAATSPQDAERRASDPQSKLQKSAKKAESNNEEQQK